MTWEILADSRLIENLGWTLVHSVWQISLTTSVLFLVLRIFNNISANLRYLFATAALSFVLILPVVTFVQLTNGSSLNQFPDKVFIAEKSNSLKKEAHSRESLTLSANNNSLTINATNESFYFSLANLRDYFKQSLISALPMFVLLWIFGVGVFAFRLCGGVWQLHKYKTQEICLPDGDWQKRFSDLCEKLKISQTVKLLQSNRIETPIVVGWLKPLILVPTSVFLQMNPHQLETILAHELIHIRRYDNLVNFMQSLIEILFFYHPCVWWISAVIRREREFACDDAVTEMFENPHIVYASALANLEEIRRLTKEKTPSFLMAASGGKLMQRINRILEKNTERQNPKQSLWSASLAFLLISAVVLSVFWTDSSFDVNAQGKSKDKKIAVGFVSIPPLDRMENPPKDADATARLLIEKLKAHKIPAIGFVQGGLISDGDKLYPVRAEIVRMWRDAGFEIGIGGYKHIWFYDTPFDEYAANVEKNEQITRKILAEKNLTLRYFSYPFLNNGKTTEDRGRFENWLNSRGLNSVKYTFDNQEWMYSYAYDMARKDNDINRMKEIRAEYLDYMKKMAAHFETYSQEMFGRDIAQTLVLTPSRLVTDTADEFFGTLAKRGYRFVTMDEAQSDEAYQTKEATVDSQSGISWFERWQMAQGKKLLDEPRVAASVWKTWNDKKGGK
jgi:beta-lactamase regulating signal transducer with metallopeptidase domain/peptidoglycan/xylan/chitin deacetylase (PgdA/CDA1 family)